MRRKCLEGEINVIKRKRGEKERETQKIFKRSNRTNRTPPKVKKIEEKKRIERKQKGKKRKEHCLQ